MKHYILSVLVAVSLLFSCSKSNNDNGGGNNNFISKPEAKAAYDKSNFGMYKGVFVGSTGYIIININNTDNTISAKVVIDGDTLIFTPSNPNITQGNAINVTFKNGSDSFVFSVDGDGSNPRVTNINISGHNGASIIIIKETSTSLVKCMEGTYTGAASGTWNAAVNNNEFKGIYNYEGDIGLVNGVVDATNKVSGTYTGGVFSGTLSGNSGGGIWKNNPDNDSGSGTWKVTRTY
jgi:hypothetical protein